MKQEISRHKLQLLILVNLAVIILVVTPASSKPIGNFCANQSGVGCNIFTNTCNQKCGNKKRISWSGIGSPQLFRSGSFLGVTQLTGQASVLRTDGTTEPLQVFSTLETAINPGDIILANSASVDITVERVDIDEDQFPAPLSTEQNTDCTGLFDELITGALTLTQLGGCAGENSCGVKVGSTRIVPQELFPDATHTVEFDVVFLSNGAFQVMVDAGSASGAVVAEDTNSCDPDSGGVLVAPGDARLFQVPSVPSASAWAIGVLTLVLIASGLANLNRQRARMT